MHERKQNVVVDGASSVPVPVLSGVPQGSMLGPLLFLTYINQVTALNLSEGTHMAVYADDILLYKPITCKEDYASLQSDIGAIHKSITTCHLTLNPSKCKHLIMSRKRQPLLPPTGLCLNGEVLELVDRYRYLGVLVTSNFTWSDHIKQISTKARRLVGMLYRQFSWADTKTILHIYITCIRPHLEYACQLWDPYTNKDAQLLEDVQKFVCKVCLKQWNIDYHSMLCLLGLPL